MTRTSPKLSTAGETYKAETDDARARADLELIRKSLVGNLEAIQELMGRLECVFSMLATKNARMGRPLDAAELEDVVQESLICIWSKRTSFRGTGSLEPWVYRICTLEYMNRMRKKQRRVRLLSGGDVDRVDPPAPPEEPADDYTLIHEGLEYVGLPDADIIRLKHFESLTFDQIAARMKIPANTAKTRYYRALRKLRKHLGGTDLDQVSPGGGHAR